MLSPFPIRRRLGVGDVTKNKHADQPTDVPLHVRMTLETSAENKDSDQSAQMYFVLHAG